MTEADRLLILIARTEECFDALVTGLVDVGIGGATVVDSRGLAAIVRDELPIFSGLSALMPATTGSRVILSLTDERRIEAILRFIGELPEEARPVGAVVPVGRTFGLRSRGPEAEGP
jgi:hypothetical protein